MTQSPLSVPAEPTTSSRTRSLILNQGWQIVGLGFEIEQHGWENAGYCTLQNLWKYSLKVQMSSKSASIGGYRCKHLVVWRLTFILSKCPRIGWRLCSEEWSVPIWEFESISESPRLQDIILMTRLIWDWELRNGSYRIRTETRTKLLEAIKLPCHPRYRQSLPSR